MKAYLIFLVVLVLSASAMSETKEVMLINESGEVKLIEKPQTWRLLSEEETTALNNPGVEVPIDTLIGTSKRIDFWHIAPTKKYNKVIVFENGQIQTSHKIGIVEDKPQVAYYVILGLIAIILMLMSNLDTIMMETRNGYTTKLLFTASFIAASRILS